MAKVSFFFICCKYVGTDNGALILGQIAVVANQPVFHREYLSKETDGKTKILMDSTVLKWILRNLVGQRELDSSGSGYGLVAGSLTR